MKDRSVRDHSRRQIDLLLLQTSIDSYRQFFLTLLDEKFQGRLLVSAGEGYFNPSVKTRVRFPIYSVKNYFLFDRKFVLQLGAIWKAVFSKNLVVEMNPRVLSTWFVMVLRRLLMRNTAVWGHFSGRSLNSTSPNPVRKGMCRIAGGSIIAYTDEEGMKFEELFPFRKVVVAPNSLYLSGAISPGDSDTGRDFIFSGRLDADKDPELILRAFLTASPALEIGSKLHFIGDGPKKDELLRIVEKSKGHESVLFHGFNADLDFLRSIFSGACASVVGGFVGLNAVQTLGFGVPLIYPQIAMQSHAPEAYLLTPLNSIGVERNCLAMSEAMIDVNQNQKYWRARAEHISGEIRTRHSVELMVKGFLSAFE